MMGLRAAWRALWQPETKASRAGPLLALMSAGQPASTPRRYERLAEEGFQKNAVVFRCVNLVAECAAAIPWLLMQGQGAARRRLEAHPLLSLLDRPNPLQGGAGFFQAVYAFRLLSGNSYIEAVGPSEGPNASRPQELWTLRPDRMEVIKGDNGQPAGYQFRSGGRSVVWRVDRVSGRSPILHTRSFHPLNDWYGMSPLEAAAFEVDQHNAAGEWNFALLKNQARPSGALVYAPRDQGAPDVLSDEQYGRVREQVDALSGFDAAGRPLILEGGLDWRQMSLTPTDMDWLKGRDMAARDIALVYDVPSQLIGIEGSQTFANFEQARLSFYEDAVLPLVDGYKDDLNRWLVPLFGDDLELCLDEDGIPALAPRRQRKWAMVKGATFLTVNEQRRLLGFAPIAGGEVLAVGRGPKTEPPGRAKQKNGKSGITRL